MSFKTHALRAGAFSAAALLALTACGNGDDNGDEPDDDNGAAEENGDNGEATAEGDTLTLALFGEEPYSWLDESGEPTGATIAVAEEIFSNRLGYDLEVEQTDWGNLITGLNAGHWDVVSAGMSINAERCAEAAFGEPELIYQTAFLLEEGNPADVHTFEDLIDADLDVVALSGGVESPWLGEVGVDHDTVDNAQDGIDFVEGGRADVFALTAASLQAMAGDSPGLEVTDPFTHEFSVGAHTFRTEDQDLIDEFNEELADLMESGEYLDIVGEFGFTEDQIPPIELTAQELCEQDADEVAAEYGLDD
ncbi:transporter substrate-binding domain-containing protein [Nesterenkonia muleiensis]|uniref:transporter substrate-binding domain-containing protein n=1 Tax=Nesterenkonia muleiensis TaxID=2282648 RepID=UPI000E748550|nr:transporter substrate-binding domain-containing protein [Nesterenkonia muleiensis]